MQIPDFTNVREVAGVGLHSAALKNDGTVWTWGDNYFGQLGDGSNISRGIPTLVPELSSIINVKTGEYHSIALKNNGTVWTWGYNSYGQLGDGTETSRTTPVQASVLNNIIQIAAGDEHSIALKSDGTVWTWGYNGSGQLGDGTETSRTTPVQVSVLNNIIQIAAGNYYSLALRSDGTVWAWGYNAYGQLGDGTTVQERIIPVQVTSLANITQVAAGVEHSIALKDDGTVWAWGYNAFGQLGDGSTITRRTPVQVTSLADITQVAAGSKHSVALKDDGTVWAWGYNGSGQVGDGSTITRKTPVQVTSLADITQITAGYNHSMTIADDDTVWVWGDNKSGQLGDGRYCYRVSPYCVEGEVNDVQGNTWSDANIVTANRPVSAAIDYSNEEDWFFFAPKYNDTYMVIVSNGYAIEVNQYRFNTLTPISTFATGVEMAYPQKYYIKVIKPNGGTGSYTLQVSNSGNYTVGKAYLTEVGGCEYYSNTNANDGGSLYRDNTELYSAPSSWIAALGSDIYFNSNGLKKLSISTSEVTNVDLSINPYFIVSDGSNLYYSNWADSGRIYKYNVSTGAPTLVCKDIGSWLEIDGDYIYYQNNLDKCNLYKVPKTAVNAENGEIVE